MVPVAFLGVLDNSREAFHLVAVFNPPFFSLVGEPVEFGLPFLKSLREAPNLLFRVRVATAHEVKALLELQSGTRFHS